MAARDHQTSLELLQADVMWKELRAVYWQDSHPDYAKQCAAKDQGHCNRLTVELRDREAA